ncbi:MAG: type II toxin-antitoxin system prevent-host-death family antitoxin [Planctomycetes bacterium]|nr:type II toxin-antitoxin system prevent-host-death family antitoxin [Planctomycetota bacterium]
MKPHKSLRRKSASKHPSGFEVRENATLSNPSIGSIQQIGVSDLKAHCLEIISNVAERGESYIITKHGEPVARIVPHERKIKSLKGAFRNHLKVVGDIIHCDFSEDWEALK